MPSSLPVLLSLVRLFLAVPDDVDDRYRFVAGLYEKGLYDLTVKEAKSFLEEHSDHPKADLTRYRLASALFELNKLEEATPLYRLLSGRPGFEFQAEACLRLGQCELSAKRYEPAVTAFEKCLGLGKDYLKAPATFLTGEAEFRREKFAPAEARYAEALRLAPQGEHARDAAYGLAWCAFRLEKYDVAVERIEDFLKGHRNDPLDQELRFLLGEAHLEAGRPKEALTAYRTVNEGPFEDAALRGAGFSLAALGDHAGAAREFGSLLERFPKSRFAAEAALHRGIELLEAGDAPGAIEALALPAVGDGADALYYRARAKAKEGRKEEALADLERALQSKPSDDLAERIQVARGDVLFDLNRPADSMKAYERSGSDYALHAAAVASLNAGRPEEAIRLAQKLLSDHPSSPYAAQAQLALGEALLSEKKYGEAEQAFSAAADAGGSKADPARRTRARSRIAWCRYLQNDAAKAARLFTEVAREAPQGPEAEEAVFMAGRAFEAAGSPEPAAKAWNRYLEQYPQGSRRAEVLLGLSRVEQGPKASSRLEAIVDRHSDSPLAAQALYDLAERLYAEKKRDEAEARYRELLSKFPKSDLAPPSRYGLAWCLYEGERFAEAATALEEVAISGSPLIKPDLKISSLELYVWSTCKARDAARAAAAFRAFSGACDDEARRFRAARTTCQLLKAAGQPDDARAVLDEASRGATSREVRAGVAVERAYLALDEKKVDEAEAQVRAALGLTPDDASLLEACFFVGEAFFEAGNDAKAIELYRPAAGTPGPIASRALYKEGFARLRQNDLEGAARCFRSLVESDPKSDLYGEGLFLLGESLFRLERFDEAASSLGKLRKEAPKHEVMPKALFRLGIALCKIQKWSEAEAALSDLARGYAGFENGVEAELWRGRALAAHDNRRGARQALDRVIQKDHGVLAAQARLELGKLLLKSGDAEEALSEFLKVSVLYAHDAEVTEGLFLAGKCLESMGDTAKARSQYQEIHDKHATSSFADAARERLRATGSF